MNENYVTLGQVCDKGSSNIAQKDLAEREGQYPIYGAAGLIKNVDFAHQKQPYIAVVKDGAGIGRVMKLPADSSVIGTMQYILPKKNVDIDYLFYALQHMNLGKYFSGSTIPHIYFRDYQKERLKLPAMKVQQHQAEVLGRIDALSSDGRKQIDLLDELVKSRFVEMFGDTLLNTKEWTENFLETLADIVSGITKGRKVKEGSLVEVPYMAVSNVKDGHIDWTTVKTIMATRQEINQYRLQSDDVLMTEGGDPDKVGRGAIIKNHVFRVRLDEGNILPTYFAEYLQHQKAKRYFLGCAKQTTGIASINMRQLKSLPVLLPPLEFQNRFAAFVSEVDKSKLAVKQSLEKLETLKKSLMQQYFG